jgi:hypothetical protein
MHKVGDDVWTPMAVKCIKGRASKHLWQVLESVLGDREMVEATLTNGSTNSQPKEPEPEPEHENQLEHDPETNGNVKSGDNLEHPNHESELKEADTNNNEASDIKPNGAPEPTTRVKLNSHDVDYSRKVIGKDWAIQLLFDTLYLDEALLRKGANAGSSGITSLAGKVESAVGTELGFNEELRRRLEGGAREYWKRTCLLFALLS